MTNEEHDYHVSVAGSPPGRVRARSARQAAYRAAHATTVGVPGARVTVTDSEGNVREFWPRMGEGNV